MNPNEKSISLANNTFGWHYAIQTVLWTQKELCFQRELHLSVNKESFLEVEWVLRHNNTDSYCDRNKTA